MGMWNCNKGECHVVECQGDIVLLRYVMKHFARCMVKRQQVSEKTGSFWRSARDPSGTHAAWNYARISAKVYGWMRSMHSHRVTQYQPGHRISKRTPNSPRMPIQLLNTTNIHFFLYSNVFWFRFLIFFVHFQILKKFYLFSKICFFYLC